MNNEVNDSFNSLTEQREHGELAHNSASQCSQQYSTSENNENIFTFETENPINSEPIQISKPDIKRPCYQSHVDWIQVEERVLKSGLYYHCEELKNEETVLVDEWVCSPLEVLAITSSTQGSDFGRLLRFLDSNGIWHEWAMPMHMLKSNGDELCGELLHQGLIFDHKHRKKMIHYIMSSKPKRKILAACSVGWYGSTFVLPNQIIGSEDVVFQTEIAGESDFSTLGTLQEWKENIGIYCEDNIPLMMSISANLAGPLLKSLNRQQGGAIHWVGDSSTGKSTAIEIGATVWGSPEFIRSWCTTANGFEGVAAARNDTCIVLDEINEASPHEIGKIVYSIINGQGKQRANRIGGARKIQRWRVMAISSGEKTLESIMKEAGKQVNAGQAVRLLNIPAKFKYGVFNNLHGFKDGRSLADHFKTTRLKYYGHAGPAFVRFLINERRNLNELLDAITNKFIEQAVSNLEKRAASVFAIIGLAGELGIEYKILPWKEGSSLDAAFKAFLHWQDFQGSSQTEDQKILQFITSFIDKYGDSHFSVLPDIDNKIIHDRAGWYKDKDGGRIFMFTATGLQDAVPGYERKRIVDALVSCNWLTENDTGRQTKKTRTSSGLKNLYYVAIPDVEGC